MKFKTRRYYIYYLSRTLFFLIGLMPLKISLAVADFLGKTAFWLIPRYRKVAVSNLDTVFDSNHRRNVRLAIRVFANLAKNGIEWIKLSSLDPGSLGNLVTEIQGREHLDAVLSEGKGAVVLAFHFGNWELLAFYLRQMGYKGKVIVRRIYFHKYDKIITNMRYRLGVRGIYRDESPKKMLRELKEGRILGVLADQDVDNVDGVFVNFFGRPAYTPTAPVRLAMAAGTKLVPSFVIRKPDNTHKIVLEKPIDVSAGTNTGEDVKRYTQLWTDILEKYVREYPEQWVWVHSRWKTRAGDRSRVIEP